MRLLPIVCEGQNEKWFECGLSKSRGSNGTAKTPCPIPKNSFGQGKGYWWCHQYLGEGKGEGVWVGLGELVLLPMHVKGDMKNGLDRSRGIGCIANTLSPT